MGMLDALKEVKTENFDPKKDKIGGSFVPIPDGTYTVTLSDVNHGVYKKSNKEFLAFVFEVAVGDHAGEKEYYRPIMSETKNNGEPMPSSVLIRSIKTIQKIGALVDFNVPEKCFMGHNESENDELIKDAFHNAKVFGKVLSLTIKTNPNKQNPQYPYRNLVFEAAEQPTKEELGVDITADPNDTIDPSKFPF